jgi:hypothetical protein
VPHSLTWHPIHQEAEYYEACWEVALAGMPERWSWIRAAQIKNPGNTLELD